MRLRRPCVHDRYEPHRMADRWMEPLDCPGGEFLPEDAWGVNEIIAEVDRLEKVVSEMRQPVTIRQVIAAVLLDYNERGVLADQVGEPG